MIVGQNDGLADVVSRARKSGHDDLRTPARLHLSSAEPIAQHAIVCAEVEATITPRETASTKTRTELRLLIGAAVAVVIAKAHDAERRLYIARTVDRDEDVAVRHDRHVASRRRRTVLREVRDDECAESR